VDAALRLVGAEGGETVTAIAARLKIAKSTLSRHRTGAGCLALDAAPAAPPGMAGLREGHEAEGTAEPREAAITAAIAAGKSGMALPRAVPSRSPFAFLPSHDADPVTSPRKLVAADIERRAIDLRVRGKSFADIAEELGVTEDTAADTVERVLLRTRNRADSKAEQARALAVRQCDAVIGSFWDRATDPTRSLSSSEDGSMYDPSQDKAGLVLIKAMERKAKLLGLDTPTSGPLVNVNVFTDPRIAGAFRALGAALDEEVDPTVKGRILGKLRAAMAGAGAGAPLALQRQAPQVIEMVVEASPDGAPS